VECPAKKIAARTGGLDGGVKLALIRHHRLRFWLTGLLVSRMTMRFLITS
jgi:hypothetical protein